MAIIAYIFKDIFQVSEFYYISSIDYSIYLVDVIPRVLLKSFLSLSRKIFHFLTLSKLWLPSILLYKASKSF